MTLFLLIRHGDTDAIGQMVPGRMPGVDLNDAGRKQAKHLAESLMGVSIDQIFASPMERARQTAQPIAERHGLEIRISEAIDEVDFGDWTGMRFDELEKTADWQHYNRFRAGIPTPGGESFVEIQARMLREIRRIHRDAPGQTIALVSHADSIKAVITALAGIPVGNLMAFEISPASVSIVDYWEHGAKMLCLNRTVDFPEFKEGLPM